MSGNSQAASNSAVRALEIHSTGLLFFVAFITRFAFGNRLTVKIQFIWRMDIDNLGRQLLSILSGILLFAHPSVSAAKINDLAVKEQFVEDISKYRRQFKGAASASSLLQHIPVSFRSGAEEVAYKIALAQRYAETSDTDNEQSETLLHEAVSTAQALGDDGLLVFALVQHGYHYYGVRRISKALPSIMEAVFLLDRDPDITPPFADDVYKKIGYFLGTIGDNKRARIFLCRALKSVNATNGPGRAALLDNLGLYTLRANDTVAAQRHFCAAMKIAKAEQDTLRQAKIIGNLALIAWARNHRDSAIRHLQEDVWLSVGEKGALNRLYATNMLAKILLEKGRVQEAKAYIAAIRGFAESHENLIVHRHGMHQLLLEIAVLERNEKQEMAERRLLYALQDSLNLFDGENVTQQARWLAEQKIASERLSQSDRNYVSEHRKVLLYALGGGGLLVLCLAFIGYSHRKRKEERRDDLAELRDLRAETQRLDQRLSSAASSIAAYDASSQRKDILIRDLQHVLRTHAAAPEHNKESEVLPLLSSHLLTEKNWEQFKKAFVAEYGDFYNELRLGFPELSESNLRLALLWKLDISTAEISRLLGITAEAVKKSRQRMRKKFGDERFAAFQALLAKPFGLE